MHSEVEPVSSRSHHGPSKIRPCPPPVLRAGPSVRSEFPKRTATWRRIDPLDEAVAARERAPVSCRKIHRDEIEHVYTPRRRVARAHRRCSRLEPEPPSLCVPRNAGLGPSCPTRRRCRGHGGSPATRHAAHAARHGPSGPAAERSSIVSSKRVFDRKPTEIERPHGRRVHRRRAAQRGRSRARRAQPDVARAHRCEVGRARRRGKEREGRRASR